MLLRSQLGHLSRGLYSNSSSTQPVLCTATGRPQGARTHTISKSAATLYAVQVSHSQLGRWAAGASSSSSLFARSAGVICRDAPRPMWAAKTPKDDAPKVIGSELEKQITQDIKACDNAVELANVFNEWGGSFNYIHASAALVQYCKVARKGGNKQLLGNLLRSWLQQLPVADLQGCAIVLYSLGKLGTVGTGLDEVWEPTFKAYLGLLQQGTQGDIIRPQGLSNTLWACATLRKQPAPDQLQVLMQAVLQPDVQADGNPQHLSNIIWVLGKLCQLQSWQGGIVEEAIQQLLGPQQLQVLSSGTDQDIANVLLGLTDMSTAAAPVVSKAFAQQCSRQLLADTVQCLITSKPQPVGNAMWVCGELGLTDVPFLATAAAAAADWVPISRMENVLQAATACAKLQFRHQGLMTALLQRGQQLLQPSGAQGRQQRPLHSRGLGPGEKDKLVSRVCLGCCTVRHAATGAAGDGACGQL